MKKPCATRIFRKKYINRISKRGKKDFFLAYNDIETFQDYKYVGEEGGEREGKREWGRGRESVCDREREKEGECVCVR